MGKIWAKLRKKDPDGGGGASSRQRNVDYDPNAKKEVKMVLVGDTTVGKSCLIVNY